MFPFQVFEPVAFWWWRLWRGGSPLSLISSSNLIIKFLSLSFQSLSVIFSSHPLKLLIHNHVVIFSFRLLATFLCVCVSSKRFCLEGESSLQDTHIWPINHEPLVTIESTWSNDNETDEHAADEIVQIFTLMKEESEREREKEMTGAKGMNNTKNLKKRLLSSTH